MGQIRKAHITRQEQLVVGVDRLFDKKLYNGYVKRTSKFMAHDDKDSCNIGDRVKLEILRGHRARYELKFC